MNAESTTLRPAQPGDAERVITYVLEVLREPGVHLLSNADDFQARYPPEKEREFLARVAESERDLFLLAEEEGEIIGQLSLMAGKREADRHELTLGITVRRDRRNQGVGRRLLDAGLAWARQAPGINRIELQVFTANAAAIHLYESLGFQIEGRRRRAIFRDGVFHDELIMAMLL